MGSETFCVLCLSTHPPSQWGMTGVSGLSGRKVQLDENGALVSGKILLAHPARAREIEKLANGRNLRICIDKYNVREYPTILSLYLFAPTC